MKNLVLLVFTIIILSCGRPLIKQLQSKDFINEQVKKPTLVMIASPKCGYSHLAKKTINTYIGNDSVELIFVEFEVTGVDTLSNGLVIGSKQLDKFKYKFFPQFILLTPQVKKQKHIKGWDEKRKNTIVNFLEKNS